MCWCTFSWPLRDAVQVLLWPLPGRQRDSNPRLDVLAICHVAFWYVSPLRSSHLSSGPKAVPTSVDPGGSSLLTRPSLGRDLPSCEARVFDPPPHRGGWYGRTPIHRPISQISGGKRGMMGV